MLEDEVDVDLARYDARGGSRSRTPRHNGNLASRSGMKSICLSSHDSAPSTTSNHRRRAHRNANEHRRFIMAEFQALIMYFFIGRDRQLRGIGNSSQSMRADWVPATPPSR